jgi:predicted PurR-regulated permease PerM
MVIGDYPFLLAAALLAAGESTEPLINRLDPPRRAAVLMAILALVITGIAMVACVMIGARWVRRLARHQHGRTKHTTHIENQRLRDNLRPILPEGQSGETTIAKRASDETVSNG